MAVYGTKECSHLRCLKAGNLDAIVDAVVPVDAADSRPVDCQHMHALLTTYPAFATDRELLASIVYKLEICANSDSKLAKRRREALYATLKEFLSILFDRPSNEVFATVKSNQAVAGNRARAQTTETIEQLPTSRNALIPTEQSDLSIELAKTSATVRAEIVSEDEEAASQTPLESLLHRLQNLQRPLPWCLVSLVADVLSRRPQSQAEIACTPPSPVRRRRLDWDSLDNRQVAEQLTRQDASLMLRLRLHECLGVFWGRRQSPSVSATVQQFNRVCGSVTATVAGGVGKPSRRQSAE
uniref:Ras-GEF domain-containing protein n=1 Tax=Macrostomum lignano TaxID=282301 RepID=A0A1I8IKL9_9PLAT